MTMPEQAEIVRHHVRRMRLAWAALVATVPIAAGVALAAPRMATDLGSPSTVTLLALVISLWVGFTAERDSRARLDRIKRAFAVHGELVRLLRDHLTVLLIVLLRLEVIVVGGIVISIWGIGPRLGVWIVLLGGLMMALAWPSIRKTQILILRARELQT
jgi:hypothetical protein